MARYQYPKDFDEKIKEMLESDTKEQVRLGVHMLLRQQGFVAGKTLWIEDMDTCHPIPFVLVHVVVKFERGNTIGKPTVDLMCVDVMHNWDSDGGEHVELGVIWNDVLEKIALGEYTYERALNRGVDRMKYHLDEFNGSVERFDASVTKLEAALKKARYQRKVQKNNVKNCKERLERLKNDQSGKEALEYLASIQRKLLSQIVPINEEESQ